MPVHIALLRGVNVGGRTRVGMADLRELFTGLGHGDVRTYLQSGNVVFTAAADRDARTLAAEAEERIAAELGVDTAVLLRTGGDLARILASHPFAGEEPDPAALHVTFLAEEPAPDRAARLEVPPGETARFSLQGREVHLHCPDGYGRTKLNNAFVERRLGVAATTRNRRTVTALHALAAS
ncbi:DUF1697 domain-containing protein [Streptacidiphilus sp. ASG 303]|uniref:DUF1697 domain-containing protein n=1 Tax=Streptacidiphilus sp. ASG 303 TaxID=2896847 RepID=UPI001E48E0BA|nr:DUF1697 domain-containing protein [Streptacidiphilus sp. ASG 303]MCD0481044.1 DUF1697 domain-containing protein [Streptacidiphilus sp. ASG 303]